MIVATIVQAASELASLGILAAAGAGWAHVYDRRSPATAEAEVATAATAPSEI